MAVINFIAGTKAQFIKLAPIMKELEKRGVNYNIVDLGQHATLVHELITIFELKGKKISISRIQNIDSIAKGLAWLLQNLFQIFFAKKKLIEAFGETNSISIIHGDTASTLLGALICRSINSTIFLVEAGLTSGKWFNPFPEEIIRKIAEKMASVLFCPNEKETNALKLHFQGKNKNIIYTNGNTGRDAFVQAISLNIKTSLLCETYSVMSIHRLETITDRNRLNKIINYACEFSQKVHSLIFIMHPPTKIKLESFGLYDKIKNNPNIFIHTLFTFFEFISVLKKTQYIFTDGGSIQEEASYLKKGCIIMREVTERTDGLGLNAKLTTWNFNQDILFLKEHKENIEQNIDWPSPSKIITENIIKTLATNHSTGNS